MNESNGEHLGFLPRKWKRGSNRPMLTQTTLVYMLLVLGAIVVCEYIGIVALSKTKADTTKCMQHTGTFMVLSGVWILLNSLIGWRVTQRQQSRNYSTSSTGWETLLSIIACGGCLIIGIAGLVLGSQKACKQQQQQTAGSSSQWIVQASLAVGALFLMGTVFLVGRFLYKSVENMAPGQETSFALICIRCSCISQQLRHILLTIPCLVLCLLNAFFTYELSDISNTLDKRCPLFGSSSSVLNLQHLLYSTTTIYAIMFLAMVLSSYYCNKEPVDSSSSIPLAIDPKTFASSSMKPARNPRRTLKQKKRLVLAAICSCAVVCIICASIGSVWIKDSIKSFQGLTCSDEDESLAVSEEILGFAHAAVIELFVTGIGLLVFGTCCRMEECFIPASSTANSIEISMTIGNLKIPNSQDKPDVQAIEVVV